MKITRKDLVHFSNSVIYDIAAGIRGPDGSRCYFLKHLFTERIRYFAGVPYYVAVRGEKKVSKDTVERAFSEAVQGEGTPHFLTHVVVALNALLDVKGFSEEEYHEMSALRDVAWKMHNVAICRREYTREKKEEKLKYILSILRDAGILEG